MASRNPFGLLNVHRDEEDEEVTQTKAQTTTTGATLFAQPQADQKKKKKVRPEEKRKLEDTKVEDDNEEGFEVVKKKVPTKQRAQQNEDGKVPEEKTKQHHMKNKGAFHERTDKVTPGKRQYDKQSGTGRGREVAKGGAGGKHTWGTNPRNVARKYDEEYNGDEAVFNRVLNAKPREAKTEEKEQEVVPEVTVPKVVETPKEPETVEVTEEVKEAYEKFDRRRKGKKGETEEVNKEDLLERPENALSFAEYKEQLKLKNQALNQNKTRTVVNEQSVDLKPRTRDEAQDAIGLSQTDQNKKPKAKKEKKTETNELAYAFKTEDEGERRYDNKVDKLFGGKKKGNKFHFSQEDFPEL